MGNSLYLNIPRGIEKPRQIFGGPLHTCVLDSDNKIKCWGDGISYYNLNMPELKNPIDVAIGLRHFCALDSEGVKCWGGGSAYGQNQNGQLDVPKNLKNPTEITAGYYNSCAKTDEGVQCWGGYITSRTEY